MAIDNHSTEAAYATKDNIVVPAYVDVTAVMEADVRALLDLADTSRIGVEALMTAVFNLEVAVGVATASAHTADASAGQDQFALAQTRNDIAQARWDADLADAAATAVNDAVVVFLDRIRQAAE